MTQDLAATTINACARGYLVRRLFRTEHVQNIVKIVQETLILILNIHQEDGNDSQADNNLKSYLLQQVSLLLFLSK